MLNAETYFLEAVRDVLRKKLSLGELQCDCEPDEQVPAIAGDMYFAVIPGGISPGPKQNTSGGVQDVIHSVQVAVISRMVTARDRQRHMFLTRLKGVNNEVSRVLMALDWQNDVMSLANAKLYQDYPTAKPFIETLRLSRVDAKPRVVTGDIYGGGHTAKEGTTDYIAMMRSVYFGGMRRIEYINQLTPTGRV